MIMSLKIVTKFHLKNLCFSDDFKGNWIQLICSKLPNIRSKRESNGIQTHNHLVRKRTINYKVSLAKWLSGHLRTKWLWIRITENSDIAPVSSKEFLETQATIVCRFMSLEVKFTVIRSKVWKRDETIP